MKGLYAADGVGIVIVQSIASLSFFDPRSRQKWLEIAGAQTRTAARAAAPVRCRECLMQVQMNHINAHVARASNPDESVHVGAVHINEAAGGVNGLAYLFDVF